MSWMRESGRWIPKEERNYMTWQQFRWWVSVTKGRKSHG